MKEGSTRQTPTQKTNKGLKKNMIANIVTLFISAVSLGVAFSAYQEIKEQDPVRILSSYQNQLRQAYDEIDSLKALYIARMEMDKQSDSALISQVDMLAIQLAELGFSNNRSGTIATYHENHLGLGGPDNLFPNEETLVKKLDSIDGVETIYSKKHNDDSVISGFPIKQGYISSRYGSRRDPFTGKTSSHTGVDIAVEEGAKVYATANGIVSYAGEKGAYGYLVEIKHDDGYVTSYSHCKQIFVKKGDLAQKGAVIALSGNTGRSTGPHLHYEVSLNGKTLDPSSFIYR